MDLEIQTKKVGKLNKELLDMDRQKYRAELKVKETIDEMRKSQRTSQRQNQGAIVGQSGMQQQLTKKDKELK